MADDYECTLDAASIKKAKAELNEDPADRLDAVKALREWLLKQPHITSRSDTEFLLRILRYKKFSQLESRKAIETYWNMRKNNAKWYQNIDTRANDFQAVLDDQACFILPGTTNDGRTVILFDEGAFDPSFKKYTKDSFFKTATAVFELACRPEHAQVNGLVMIADLTTFTLKHQMSFSMDDMKRSFAAWQGCFPARFKEFHYYNIGAFYEWLMGIVSLLMKKKFKDRLKVHGNSMEGVYNDIPMRMLPREYLPDDYNGPCAGTKAELAANLKKLMTGDEVHAYFKRESDPKWRVDETKRPDEAPPTAHFRKLTVD